MEVIKIGKFGLGITFSIESDGNISFETTTVNGGVPEEIVIMQLWKYLKSLEQAYLEDPAQSE